MKRNIKLKMTHPVHSGMYLCEKCMSWDGQLIKDDPHTNEKIWIEVSCLCQSLNCKKCDHSKKIQGTYVWKLYDDSYSYVAHSPMYKPCPKCGNKMSKK